MKSATGIIVAAAVLLGAGTAGYWFGTRTVQAPSALATTDKAERKPLYYRNPMGLADTSPVPKKDAMGMDYVPVYEGDAQPGEGNAISMSVEKVQKLGVKSEAAALRALDKSVRAAGRIEIDERRTYTIAPKFEGWVERLYVNTGGQPVGKGQPLFDVYSPELVSAQREYAIALQGVSSMKEADGDAQKSMKQLAESSLARLKNWDIEDGQLKVSGNGKSRRSLTFYAPVSGIVLEKKAVQGMRFMPGEVLYQIADLSSVWVVADVAEQDIGQVKTGSAAKVSLDAYPDKSFDGKVAFIYPTLNAATRTVQVRVEIANPQGLLKPAMFAKVTLSAGAGNKVLTVPTSAVIDSGTRQVVLVQLAQGRFEPRSVRLGLRSDDYVEMLEGVAEGEQVVTSANFLIDAESNLKAALSGFGGRNSADNSGRNLEEPSRADGVQGARSTATETYPVGRRGSEHRATQQSERAAGSSRVSVGHQAHGILEAVNADGTVSITHEPIATLGWPGMTMDFELANSALAEGIPPGSAISFELVERNPDEWVITKLRVRAQQRHQGH